MRSPIKDVLAYCALVLSCLALALAAWPIVHPQAGPSAAQFKARPAGARVSVEDKTDDASAVLRLRIDALERQVGRLQVDLEPRTAVVDTASALAKETASWPAASTAMDSAAGDASTTVTTLQQRFALEPIDSAAGFEVEDAVGALLVENQITATGLQHVDCYETACWLEFDHLDGIADDSFIDTLQDTELFAGEFYVETLTEPSGFARTVVVLAKPGYALPSLL